MKISLKLSTFLLVLALLGFGCSKTEESGEITYKEIFLNKHISIIIKKKNKIFIKLRIYYLTIEFIKFLFIII